MVLAAPQLLASLGIDQVGGTRENNTHFHHSPSASTTHLCTIYQELHTFLQIINHTHQQKSWSIEAQDHSKWRRSSTQQQLQEVQATEAYQEEKGKQESNQEEKDKLGASLNSPASSSRFPTSSHHSIIHHRLVACTE
jgi:hypothetical protein